MSEKLKAFGEAAKAVLVYVLAPLACILGYIYYLTAKNTTLKDELAAGKRDERTKELENDTKEVDRSADDAVAEYERQRRAYMQAVDRELRQGTGSAEGTDPDQGSKD